MLQIHYTNYINNKLQIHIKFDIIKQYKIDIGNITKSSESRTDEMRTKWKLLSDNNEELMEC